MPGNKIRSRKTFVTQQAFANWEFSKEKVQSPLDDVLTGETGHQGENSVLFHVYLETIFNFLSLKDYRAIC